MAGSKNSDEQEEMEKNMQDLSMYEAMMKELVAKFSEPTTSYAQKLQILTISPYTKEITKRNLMQHITW